MGQEATRALVSLAEESADAIMNVSMMLGMGDGVMPANITPFPGGDTPFANLTWPYETVRVGYADGAVGGNLLAVTRLAARRMAAAMMQGPDAALAISDGASPLSELEQSALQEAMNQMMAAAAAATSKVIGQEINISTPILQTMHSQEEATLATEATPMAVRLDLRIFHEPCVLVQLVPNAFVIRMGRALDIASQVTEANLATAATASDGASGNDLLESSEAADAARRLEEVTVRVWAEIGRLTLPIGTAVSLTPGQVRDLDRMVDEPALIYANGERIGTGRVVATEQGRWAVDIEELFGAPGAHGDETQQKRARSKTWQRS